MHPKWKGRSIIILLFAGDIVLYIENLKDSIRKKKWTVGTNKKFRLLLIKSVYRNELHFSTLTKFELPFYTLTNYQKEKSQSHLL